jgi:hypothetical protein
MTIESIFLAGFVILAIIFCFVGLKSWVEENRALNQDSEEDIDNETIFPPC